MQRKKNLQGLELPIIATPSRKHEQDRDANAGRWEWVWVRTGAGVGAGGCGCPVVFLGGTAFFSPFCQGWGLGVHRGLGGFIDGQSSCGFPDGPGSYWG